MRGDEACGGLRVLALVIALAWCVPMQVMDVLSYGESNRTVAETAMNAVSSRSHSVFCIKVGRRCCDVCVCD